MSPVTDGRLTAILANYNHAAFLPHAVGSILGQSQPAARVLIIDDASTDGSVDTIRALATRDTSVDYVVNPHNTGVGAVNNGGLAMADTEYVGFFAADDVYANTMFEKLTGALDKHPRAAFASAFDGWIDESGEPLPQLRRVVPKPGCFYEPHEALRWMERFGPFFGGCSCIYRSELLRRIGGFDTAMGAYQDGIARELLAATHGTCFIPEELAYWRKLGGSVSSQGVRDVDAMAELIEYLAEYLSGELAACFSARYRRRLLDRLRYDALIGFLASAHWSPHLVERILGRRRPVLNAALGRLRRPRSGRWTNLLLGFFLVPNAIFGSLHARLSSSLNARTRARRASDAA